MKITKEQLKQIIKEEYINEITPSTKTDPGGFQGIIKMAEQAAIAADNLETKITQATKRSQGPLFQDDPDYDIPEELIVIQRFIESIKKAAMWQSAANVAPSAMHQMDPVEYQRQVKRSHTPAYKRDDLEE
jgi:hypothetical protein